MDAWPLVAPDPCILHWLTHIPPLRSAGPRAQLCSITDALLQNKNPKLRDGFNDRTQIIVQISFLEFYSGKTPVNKLYYIGLRPRKLIQLHHRVTSWLFHRHPCCILQKNRILLFIGFVFYSIRSKTP